MSNQSNAGASLPVDRDDLEIAQEAIHKAQEELHETLEQMKEALDADEAIDPTLFQEALEQIEELEVQAHSLRKDLEKLQQQ